MTYDQLLEAVTQGEPFKMRPATPTIKDTFYAQHVIKSYRRGEIVEWHDDAPLEEVAFHLWNGWQALNPKRLTNAT